MESLEDLPFPWRRELARLLPELEPHAVDPGFGPPDHLRLFEAVTELLHCLAARQPVVLILEDLQWADEMALRLLTFLNHRLQGRSVLVVATARAEEQSDLPMLRRTLEELDREAHVAQLSLAPLSQAHTVDLVRLLARPGREGPDLIRLGEDIWRLSEGNPFVVVEAMRAVNQGLPSPGSANPSMPERVREVIARRIDRLSERSRQLVAVAAVFGREFEFALLARAAGMDEGQAAEGAEELVRRHLWQAVGDRFNFTHDRIRQAAYDRLLAPRRKLLHRLVADAMGSLYSAELERHHLALGLHYREGEVWDRARIHLRQAGITAFSRGAFRDSMACLQQARGLPDDRPHDGRKETLAIDVRFDLHHSLWALGDMASVLGCLGEAALLARELGDELRQGRAAAYECHYWWTSGDNAKALRAGEEARTLAARAGDPALLAETNFSRGLVGLAMGQYRVAADLFLANLAMIDTNRALMARAFRVSLSGAYLARCLAELGDFAGGLMYARQCVELAESSGGPFSTSGAYFGLGHLHVRRGEAAAAISVSSKAWRSVWPMVSRMPFPRRRLRWDTGTCWPDAATRRSRCSSRPCNARAPWACLPAGRSGWSILAKDICWSGRRRRHISVRSKLSSMRGLTGSLDTRRKRQGSGPTSCCDPTSPSPPRCGPYTSRLSSPRSSSECALFSPAVTSSSGSRPVAMAMVQTRRRISGQRRTCPARWDWTSG